MHYDAPPLNMLHVCTDIGKVFVLEYGGTHGTDRQTDRRTEKLYAAYYMEGVIMMIIVNTYSGVHCPLAE